MKRRVPVRKRKPRNIRTLTIVREEWHRGGYTPERGESRLLNPANGLKCCLGFLALRCGYAPEEIRSALSPSDVRNPNLFPRAFVADSIDRRNDDSELTNRLVDANDNENIRGAARERRIAKLFAEAGITVRFVDTRKETRKKHADR